MSMLICANQRARGDARERRMERGKKGIIKLKEWDHLREVRLQLGNAETRT